MCKSVVTICVIPLLNLFSRRRQRIWCLITLFANIVLTLFYVRFLFPKQESFVMNANDMKNAMLITSLATGMCTALTMQLGRLVNNVYDEVKRTNETIENNTREKEEFFATISHEIRNPLQSLQGSVELMAELRKTNSEQLEADLPQLLDICRGCCGIVINLVSNILDMSKIAADKMQLSPAATDLREVANRVLRTSRGRAEGKNIALRLECDPHLPPAVELDPQRIEQVLVNLVSNAIKFTSSKGRIVVRLAWLEGMENTTGIVLARSSWKQVMELEEESRGPLVSISLRPTRGLSRKYMETMTPSDRGGKRRLAYCPTAPAGGLRPRGPAAGVVKIEVMDSGIGIAKDGVERLFKPYQQANSSISRQVSAVRPSPI